MVPLKIAVDVMPVSGVAIATLGGSVAVVVGDVPTHSTCVPVRRKLNLHFVVKAGAEREAPLDVSLPGARANGWEDIVLIHSDTSKRAIVGPDEYRWVASPQAGVERVMLDRVGGEQARATSLVRYAKYAHFPAHNHPGGEEILVLEGTFSADGRDYPAGSYLRNPPGSAHRPYTRDGATIFVKLRQMTERETEYVRVDTRDPASWTTREGRDVCPLFADDIERVRIERVAPGETILEQHEGGAEMLVLAGELHEGAARYVTGTWLRLPDGEHPEIVSGAGGATVYIEAGHLRREGSRP